MTLGATGVKEGQKVWLKSTSTTAMRPGVKNELEQGTVKSKSELDNSFIVKLRTGDAKVTSPPSGPEKWVAYAEKPPSVGGKTRRHKRRRQTRRHSRR